MSAGSVRAHFNFRHRPVGVVRDLSQPGPEGRLVSSVISLQREVGFGKAVLEDLFNLFALREKAAGDASYLAPVTFEQLFKRRFVARTRRSDQRIICPLCE